MADATSMTVTRDGDSVAVSGEIDGRSAESFETELDSMLDGSGSAKVDLDLSAVTFMDSSGLRILLAATDRARTAGGEIAICRPSGVVRRLLELSKLDDHFTIRD